MSAALRQDVEPEFPQGVAHNPVMAFASELRRPLWAFAARHPACADLVVSFPAAAVAIATQRGGPFRALEAEAAVREGRRRRDIAGMLDIPYWMRRVPAANCDHAVPGALGFTPRNPAEAQLCRRLPSNPFGQRSWLQSVFHLITHYEEDDLAWALEYVPLTLHLGTELLDLVLACRFYAGRPDLPAARLLPGGTAPAGGFMRYWGASSAWLREIVQARLYERQQAAFEAVPEAEYQAYRFRLIYRPDDIREIAARYQNCLRDFTMMILTGNCCVFEVCTPCDGPDFLIDVRKDGDNRLWLKQAKWPGNADVDGVDLAVAQKWVETRAKDFLPMALQRIHIEDLHFAIMDALEDFFVAYPHARAAFARQDSDIVQVLQRPPRNGIGRHAHAALSWLAESARTMAEDDAALQASARRQLRQAHEIFSVLRGQRPA